MCLSNTNIKNSEQLSMCGCAMFGCDGMCFDTLSNTFRILCAPRPVFEVCPNVFFLVTAILIQRFQRPKDDRVICHPGQTQHVCLAAMLLFRLSRWMAVLLLKWTKLFLQRATLIQRIMACRTFVEKGATRSISTVTENVNVGSSKTDIFTQRLRENLPTLHFNVTE